MCLSTVWTAERQPVCKNVASVTQKDGQLVFTDIMGIPTVVNGQIEKIDLMENEIGDAAENTAAYTFTIKPFGIKTFKICE